MPSTTHVETVIVGAGPAGLQLSSDLAAAGREHLVLERGPSAGTFFRTYPRHRQLISINKPHTGTTDPELNLRMDWNSLLSDDPELLFTRYTPRYFPEADRMVDYLVDFADRRGLPVRYDADVTGVTRRGAEFVLTLAGGDTVTTPTLVMATGVSRAHVPDVPGVEHVEQYADVSVDPAEFVDQRVLILGKGNSAFETADNLIETAAVIHVAGPSSVRLAWQSHFVGHLRAVNNAFLDTYQLKSQNAVLDGSVRSIAPHPGGGFAVEFAFARSDEVVKTIRYDRVIGCTGFRFDASVFDATCRPALAIRDRFPAMSPAFESVDVPGLYFAGTIMQQRDFKHSTNGFIHGFRYAVRALGRVLAQRDHGTPWPAVTVGSDPAALADAILARVNRTSAL